MTAICRPKLVIGLVITMVVLLFDVGPASSQVRGRSNIRLPPIDSTPRDGRSAQSVVHTVNPHALASSSVSISGPIPWADVAVESLASDGDADPYAADVDVPGVQINALTVKPYGTLWTDMLYSTSRTFPGYFVLWVQSEAVQGEDSFIVEARYSRIGVDISGPGLDLGGGLKQSGKVEVDFLGSFINENTTNVRLRHVYWEAKNERMRILTGQTWDVVSPLVPNTVSFPVLFGAGNIGFRRAQFRLERYFQPADGLSFILQGALAQNINPDLVEGSTAEGVIREETSWPVLEARAAGSFSRGPGQDPIIIGISGHLGETGFDFTQPGPPPLRLPPEDDARFTTWSINLDTKLPLTQRLSLQGEFFTGANLSNRLGGILQGVCPCLRTPIRSTGGWGELTYDVTPDVHFHLGFGIDDPHNEDSFIGRTYNRVFYANVFLDLTRHLKSGLEVSMWKTLYQNETVDAPDPMDRLPDPTAPGEALVIDWTVRYSF